MYHVGFDFTFNQSDDVLIFDEADQFIFNNPVYFIKRTSNCRCIALTATPGESDSSGVEKNLLQQMGFHIYESSEIDQPNLDFDVNTLQNNKQSL